MKEIDKKYINKIYWNMLKAVIIIFYFLIIKANYENMIGTGINVLTMIFLFLSIYLFEKAYKKDDGSFALSGIETLILSTYMLTIEHNLRKFNLDVKKYFFITLFTFAIYFVLKSIIIYTMARKEVAGNYSDIREIIKKDKPQKKEASKKRISKEVNVEK